MALTSEAKHAAKHAAREAWLGRHRATRGLRYGFLLRADCPCSSHAPRRPHDVCGGATQAVFDMSSRLHARLDLKCKPITTGSKAMERNGMPCHGRSEARAVGTQEQADSLQASYKHAAGQGCWHTSTSPSRQLINYNTAGRAAAPRTAFKA
eukprot:365040-Chlamydomonas_euryale.AAC.13